MPKAGQIPPPVAGLVGRMAPLRAAACHLLLLACGSVLGGCVVAAVGAAGAGGAYYLDKEGKLPSRSAASPPAAPASQPAAVVSYQSSTAYAPPGQQALYPMLTAAAPGEAAAPFFAASAPAAGAPPGLALPAEAIAAMVAPTSQPTSSPPAPVQLVGAPMMENPPAPRAAPASQPAATQPASAPSEEPPASLLAQPPALPKVVAAAQDAPIATAPLEESTAKEPAPAKPGGAPKPAVEEPRESAPIEPASRPASSAPGRISISWSIEEEEGVAGYNVLRSSAPKGPWKTANAAMIPAAGAPFPRSYEFIDRSVRLGETYWYFLEEVLSSGARRKISEIREHTAKAAE